MANKYCNWCHEPLSIQRLALVKDAIYCCRCQTALSRRHQPVTELSSLFRAFPAESHLPYRFACLAQLHARYAPTPRALGLVWHHSIIVALIATQLRSRNQLDLDPEQVWMAALLHDLGIYKTIDWIAQYKADMSPYIRHGIIGARLLRREGFPEETARIAERHTGVGISRRDICESKLDLPSRDYLPQTELEQLVCYADKYHSKRLEFYSYEQVVNAQRARSKEKEERLTSFAQKFGIPDLDPIRALYEPWQKAFGSTDDL